MYTTNRQLCQAVTPTKHRQSKLHHIHLRVRCAYSHHAAPKVSWGWRSSRRIMKSTSGRCRMMSARPPGVPRIRDAPQKINTFPPRYRGFLENRYAPVVRRCCCAWSPCRGCKRVNSAHVRSMKPVAISEQTSPSERAHLKSEIHKR